MAIVTTGAPVAAAGTAAASARLPALAALILGLVVIGLVGFSHSAVLHNAAHDTRHSNAFPCH